MQFERSVELVVVGKPPVRALLVGKTGCSLGLLGFLPPLFRLYPQPAPVANPMMLCLAMVSYSDQEPKMRRFLLGLVLFRTSARVEPGFLMVMAVVMALDLSMSPSILTEPLT